MSDSRRRFSCTSFTGIIGALTYRSICASECSKTKRCPSGITQSEVNVMRMIFGSHEAKQPAGGYSAVYQRRALRLAAALGLIIFTFPVLAAAQTVTSVPHNAHRKLKTVAPAIVAPSPGPPEAPGPPPVRTPEQMPARVPQVLWDGKQLSIKCENSTLSDILTAVRIRTGALIEVPSSAAVERVTTNLGPASAREVLASLLSGSEFDYIIQASETNEAWVGSVILAPRGKVDGVIVAATPSASGVGGMPGHFDSGQPILEIPPGSVPENSSSSEAATGSDTAEPSPGAGSAVAEPASANPQPPIDADAQTAPPDPALADAGGSLEGADRPVAVQPVAPSSAASGASQPPSTPQTAQDLQRMYQQRRQIQTQQNQTIPAPTNQ